MELKFCKDCMYCLKSNGERVEPHDIVAIMRLYCMKYQDLVDGSARPCSDLRYGGECGAAAKGYERRYGD